jgi:triacylglycerol esterase/lipase EstA (alpha/beta hydrolase family)
MRLSRLALVAVLATLASLTVPALAGAQQTSSGPKFPFNVATLTAAPGINPPGANDWKCKPGKYTPEPVVLVHGTFADMTVSWVTIAPALKLAGYCVFALDLPKRATVPIAESAAALSAFIDKVRTSTGAAKVDVVGHSQGGVVPRYVIKNLGGASKIDDLVALAPSNHGTLLANLAGKLAQSFCKACTEQAAGSAFLKDLNKSPEAPGPVHYTNITTAYDEVVVPFVSGWLDGPSSSVTNVTLQLKCWKNDTEHLKILFDPVALQIVLNALGSTGPASPSFKPICL